MSPSNPSWKGKATRSNQKLGPAMLWPSGGDDPPVVVELKSHFNLDLVLQAVDRTSLSSHVYVAFADEKGGIWRRQRKRVAKLCRMVGMGVLLVRNDRVTPALDPQPYVPRKNTKKTARMLKEFSERVGDPNTGGVTRTKIMTAYRQDALRLLHALFQNPGQSPKALRETTGIERAAAILQDNHYGWFERVSRGIYDLSPKGLAATGLYADTIAMLVDNP